MKWDRQTDKISGYWSLSDFGGWQFKYSWTWISQTLIPQIPWLCQSEMEVPTTVSLIYFNIYILNNRQCQNNSWYNWIWDTNCKVWLYVYMQNLVELKISICICALFNWFFSVCRWCWSHSRNFTVSSQTPNTMQPQMCMLQCSSVTSSTSWFLCLDTGPLDQR